jgi:hypothetical protein
MDEGNQTTELYFEVHITLDPVFDQQRNLAAAIGLRWGFRLAELIMRKETGAPEQPHQDDTFMTARGTDWNETRRRTIATVLDLQRAGFKVRRYKVENTLVDSNYEDRYQLLKTT